MNPGETHVWLLFSHVTYDQEQQFINKAAMFGEIVDEFKTEGASTYLLVLSK